MKIIFISILLFAFVTCGFGQNRSSQLIIPKPKTVVETADVLKWELKRKLSITYDSVFFKSVAYQLQDMLKSNGLTHVSVRESKELGDVAVTYKPFSHPEKYILQVLDDSIVIEASTPSGVFYAIQSLAQLLPSKEELRRGRIQLYGVLIEDEPRFPYRGVHLDVGRHFFTTDSIKRFIDILSLHKMNTFHWHLTDDQGWRIQINKYPKLTQVGAYRSQTVIGRNSTKFDAKPHYGFYTQAEIREVVKYASDRCITIIPEIDMPGHMQAALAAYPELGCSNKQVKVAEKWGVFEDVLCVGKEQSYKFIFDVLDELMELFPSKYIHIGGDECLKDEWKKCKNCQSRIKTLNLISDDNFTAEQKLQSSFTHIVEDYLNKHHRVLIGWDEILEGGISTKATLMAWRSSDYAFEAAKLGNDAILTPNSFCYFDYYQSEDIDNEPLALGGCTTLERVYGFEPLKHAAPELIKNHILGVQANVWTEYMKTFKHVEYMLLPRLAALSEVAWSNAPKDYPNFRRRLGHLVTLYEQQGYNYAKHMFDIKKEYLRDTASQSLKVKLSTFQEGNIHYTIDGTEPSVRSLVYKSPIDIESSMILKARAYHKNDSSRVFEQKFDFNKATLKPIKLNTPSYHDYTFNGAHLLNDGLRGQKNYRSGYWLGYNNEDLSVTIDLMKKTKINSVSINAFVSTADWIFRPTHVAIYASNDDGNYELVKALNPDVCEVDVFQIESFMFDVCELNTRYVKVVVGSLKTMPDWHPATGKPAFIFVDEITIF